MTPPVLSVLTGPNIFLNICLSKIRRLFSSVIIRVQVSDEYVRTSLFRRHLRHPYGASYEALQLTKVQYITKVVF